MFHPQNNMAAEIAGVRKRGQPQVKLRQSNFLTISQIVGTIPLHLYNVTPKDNISPLTVPVNLIHGYRVRLKGIDALPPNKPNQQQIRYNVGDHVWVKTPIGRCTSPYTRRRVTGVISPQNVLVDGMPRLVRDLRPVIGLNTSESVVV